MAFDVFTFLPYQIGLCNLIISHLFDIIPDYIPTVLPHTSRHMAKDCCWNCKFYIVRGDNEPPVLGGALSNVCVFSEGEDDGRNWTEKACSTSPSFVCRHYKERFY